MSGRMDTVEWLRMKADGFYNVYERERFTEAADELAWLREAMAAARDCIHEKAYIDAVAIIDTALAIALQQKDNER